jgi:predicted ABC-type exoprotein transport system permease subunit
MPVAATLLRTPFLMQAPVAAVVVAIEAPVVTAMPQITVTDIATIGKVAVAIPYAMPITPIDAMEAVAIVNIGRA